MFRSASLFIGTSFTVAVFTIFATSNVDSIVGMPRKIYSMQRILIHIKKSISLLNVPICTQGMQRTWWSEAGTIIVTGPYCVLLFDKSLILGCLWPLVFVLNNTLILGIWCSTIPHLPGCFCPWTFFQNIGFNTVLTDPFKSHLATQLGYSAGEFGVVD